MYKIDLDEPLILYLKPTNDFLCTDNSTGANENLYVDSPPTPFSVFFRRQIDTVRLQPL